MSFASEPAVTPRWRDVHLTAVARGIAVCGDFLAATALALSLQTRGESGMAVASVMLASTVPLMLLAPFAGRMADRFNSRTLLVISGSVQAVTCAVLAHTRHPVAIVALVAVLATGLAVTSPTLGALVPDMVGRDDLPKAMAITQTATSIGMLAGPALAGLLVGQFGIRVPLLINAGTYLAIVAAGLLLRTRRGGKKVATAGDPTAATTPTVAWSFRGDTLLITMTAGVAITIAALTAVNVAEVFFVRETLESSETMYGLLGAVWTGAMLIGSWVAARTVKGRTDGSLTLLLLGLLGGTSAILMACSTVPGALWLVPLFVIGGVLNGGENVIGSLVIARRVPAEVRGRAIGTFVGTLNAANVIGFFAGGVLLGFLSPRSVLVLAGAAGLAAVIACTGPMLRAVRREARITPPVPAPDPIPVGGYRDES